MSPKEHEDLHKQEIESWKEVFIGWKHEPSPLPHKWEIYNGGTHTARKRAKPPGLLVEPACSKPKALEGLEGFRCGEPVRPGMDPTLAGWMSVGAACSDKAMFSLYLANFWMEEGKAMLSWWLWNVTWWKKWFGWGWFIPQELHLDMDKMLLCYLWLKFESLNCTR